jgi:hypothetical protein
MEPNTPADLTKRQFLRRVVVGGTVVFVAGGYEKPALETLLGSHVARANGSNANDNQQHNDNHQQDGNN